MIGTWGVSDVYKHVRQNHPLKAQEFVSYRPVSVKPRIRHPTVLESKPAILNARA